MPDPDRDHEARMTSLEQRMTTVEGHVAELRKDMAVTRQDAATAKLLAQAADRDVSAFGAELHAHTRTLNALRETQIEHGIDIATLKRDMKGARQELSLLRDEMRNGFSTLGVGMAQINAMLKNLSERD